MIEVDDVIGALALCREVSDPLKSAHSRTERPGSPARCRAGATVVGSPIITPWGSPNSRLETSDGLQLTLFEECGDEEWVGEVASSNTVGLSATNGG